RDGALDGRSEIRLGDRRECAGHLECGELGHSVAGCASIKTLLLNGCLERWNVAGRPGYGTPLIQKRSRGLIAVRCGPPDGLSRIYEAIGFAEWRRFTLVSMPDSLRSDGTAIRAIRTPPGGLEALPRSPCRPPPRRGSAVRAFTALQEVQYH